MGQRTIVGPPGLLRPGFCGVGFHEGLPRYSGSPMNEKWICSPRWDLGWLVLSALVVPLAPLLHHAGLSATGVATLVLLTVGGPHVFVTFTRTNMDPRFVKRHPAYTRLVFLIPPLTALFAWHWTALFLTVFFTWASLHVLQQITYVANSYSARQQEPPGRGERIAEYGVIFTCLYPFAMVRIHEGTFALDGTAILVPEILTGLWAVYAAFVVFGLFLAAWLAFTIRRAGRGTLHYGKTALIVATVAATLFTPLIRNLDVAFQGINAWHCVQYLALVWWANRLRRRRGEVDLPFVRALSGEGWRGVATYYGTAVGATAGILGLIYLFTWLFPGVSQLLIYYMVAKGVLLSHYYYDTFLFTRQDEVTLPGAHAAFP